MKIDLKLRKFDDLKGDFCGVKVWCKPKTTSLYCIGADVAEGIGGDASCAAVIDIRSGVHVASYWSNTCDVDTFSAELYRLGTWYNKANLCIESNNHGHAVISLLGGSVGSLAYPNLYRRIVYDEYTQKRTKQIGFKTTASTKPRLIENLKSALKSGEVITQDKFTIQELGNFVRDERTGKIGAKGKSHDDRVISLALAWEQARQIKENLQQTEESQSYRVKYDEMTGFPLFG